jgi:hypothetical protein
LLRPSGYRSSHARAFRASRHGNMAIASRAFEVFHGESAQIGAQASS